MVNPDSIHYRNPTEADIGSIVNVINSSKQELPFHKKTTAKEVDMFVFKSPDLKESGYWLAEINGKTVGYADGIIIDSRIAAGKNDSHVSVDVIPKYRGMGIETELVRLSLEYLKSKNIKSAQTIVEDQADWKKEFISKFKFNDIRHSYSMICENETEPHMYNLPDGIKFEDIMFKEINEKQLAQAVNILNETFAEHFNYSPIKIDDLIRIRDTDTGNTMTTLVKKGSKNIGIGTFDEGVSDVNPKNKVGVALGLGISKPYRKKGIGRSLLSHGMRWMWNRGIKTVNLDVDAKNADALKIYTSLGFNINSEDITYQLEL